ncbi:uncharacterized abhydrolase domain-containing protein DDB_G0269086-like isoform X2 [Pieris brassicae]|uniref:uncharacterized abhydrolase domain-containing protein DDB_G0269086-like isoform X2 n=1 Tax=Pieris brassicae TaxID=7116 RepID=UPI001E66142C|nr:uncharacterized abhydrolase domain-containing protein DDB_G0269086-like isoform X2 [Pieris brassicae]
MSKRRGFDEPNMSDTGLLVTVEDLINQAMGPPSVNMINFKVMQAVLHILARQQRLLEQRVEIKIEEVSPPRHKLKKHSEVIEDSSESSSSPSPRGRMTGIKEEREPRKRERGQREMERAEKLAQRAREKEERAASREKDRAERATSKEKEKAEKAASKERERAEKASSKEREKAEKTAIKEKERAEKVLSKERERAEKASSKEREKTAKSQLKAEKEAFKEKEKEERAASKEREKAEKAMSKAERAASKEREKEERTASKEREKAEKEQSKAERAASKEREKEERTASKEREKAEKEQSKAERAASKEREKQERAASKEREKEERATSKEREKAVKEQSKAERAASKEREKEEKIALKEKEKADKEQSKLERHAQRDLEKNEKQAQKEQDKAEREQKKAEKLSHKEQEKAERAAQKEKERMEKEKNKSAKKDRKPSDSGISIKEVKRGKDSVLVVEKGPTTWSDAQGRGSIEVVTQSQFALLEAAVKDLRDMAVPQPLAMPDNAKLRSDLAKGQATLPDTMQAMQIDARVKAAESAIARMTGLLTQLAAAGELPEDLGQQMEEIQMERAAADMRAEDLKTRPSLSRKSVIIAPSVKISEGATVPRPSTAPAPRPSVSIMKQPSSRVSTTTLDQGVTRDEMDDAVNRLREELIKSMNLMTSRAGATADNALHTAKSASDKVDVATTLDVRISTLHSLAVDYADQLHGFDAGLSTQMQSFREQMVQMRGDLQGGLTLLETVNNNAETAAVVELTSRYQELVTELESTLHSHRALTKLQTQLADELRSLVECVELLREQKADKDEVADGLRDKADTSRLAGLLTEAEFALARADLERRLAVCHDKFQRQDNVWMTAVKDLNKILDGKSEILDLLSCRDEVQKQLQLLHDRLQVLAAVLGEPKAAAVKRQLAAGASCAACGTAALMSPRDATRGAPPRLPALRPPPAGAPSKEPCLKDWMPPDLPDDRHVCRRWCGGSHTLVTESTRREQATAVVTEGAPTKRYTGFGADGRLYMMEEELQPCVECNQIAQEKCEVPPLDIGAGDQRFPVSWSGQEETVPFVSRRRK